MVHRAQQIVDAVVSALQANASIAANVYSHRTITLSKDELELPAITVNTGADEGLSEFGVTNLSFIDSLVNVDIMAIDSAATESDLISSLFEFRRQIHVSMFSASGRDLGLSFVQLIRYLGAEPPELNVDGEMITGSQISRWAVQYRMNLTDPN